MAQSEVRQRKKSAKKQPKAPKQNASVVDKVTAGTSASKEVKKDAAEETLWQTFINHPLVIAGMIVLIPLAVYKSFYFLSLQKPDLIRSATFGLVSLRPAVQLSDPRQVLVVGSMGSGTLQVASGLEQVLHLEILHESVNAQQFFVRDGTVSNFLGIRYLPRPDSTGTYVKTVAKMCLETDGVGLHPRHFRETNCSEYQKWSGCWSKACIETVDENWGCAFVDKEQSGDDGSEFSSTSGCHRPSFHTVLHLVQHPIRTIQELMAKVCPKPTMTPHPAFRQLSMPYVVADEDMLCLSEVSWYVIRFNRAMLQAREAGHVQAMYQYETTTLCDIVQSAGFLERTDEGYAKDIGNKLKQHCNADGDATKRLPMLESRDDQHRTLPNYTWDDFQTGGTALVKELRELCALLGYDADDWPWETHEKPSPEEEGPTRKEKREQARKKRQEEPKEVY